MSQNSNLQEINVENFKKPEFIDKVTGLSDLRATDEEFQNFMQRVNEVEKAVNKMTSSDQKDQELGMVLADQILNSSDSSKELEVREDEELVTKCSRTHINKVKEVVNNPNEISKEAFMSSVEKDAKERFERRKMDNERADTYKRIGNAAFRDQKFEKAITYFTKALEHRKDSSVLWNNRALCYMKLSLHEKALEDCEWALKINESNLKALLNSAKCHWHLKNEDECRKYIDFAKERNPNFNKYINEFEKELCTHL